MTMIAAFASAAAAAVTKEEVIVVASPGLDVSLTY